MRILALRGWRLGVGLLSTVSIQRRTPAEPPTGPITFSNLSIYPGRPRRRTPSTCVRFVRFPPMGPGSGSPPTCVRFVRFPPVGPGGGSPPHVSGLSGFPRAAGAADLSTSVRFVYLPRNRALPRPAIPPGNILSRWTFARTPPSGELQEFHAQPAVTGNGQGANPNACRATESDAVRRTAYRPAFRPFTRPAPALPAGNLARDHIP